MCPKGLDRHCTGHRHRSGLYDFRVQRLRFAGLKEFQTNGIRINTAGDVGVRHLTCEKHSVAGTSTLIWPDGFVAPLFSSHPSVHNVAALQQASRHRIQIMKDAEHSTIRTPSRVPLDSKNKTPRARTHPRCSIAGTTWDTSAGSWCTRNKKKQTQPKEVKENNETNLAFPATELEERNQAFQKQARRQQKRAKIPLRLHMLVCPRNSIQHC